MYVDGKLPFGLRSAPKIFNALADGLEWCVSKEGVPYIYHYLDDFIVLGPPGSPVCPKIFNALADGLEWCVSKEGVPYIYHYLDDFIVLGPPGSPVCSQSLLTLKQLCSELNIPLAEDKQDGPTPVITFLGIVIDTVRGELRLPEDKLRRLTEEVQQRLGRKSCTRRELESLIGVLHHACKVIRPGRPFLRRAITLLSTFKRRHHHIRLNKDFEAQYQFTIISTNLPGIHNDLADDLSWNNLPSFLTKMHNVSPSSTVIHPSLLQWLLHPNLDWTSPPGQCC